MTNFNGDFRKIILNSCLIICEVIKHYHFNTFNNFYCTSYLFFDILALKWLFC